MTLSIACPEEDLQFSSRRCFNSTGRLRQELANGILEAMVLLRWPPRASLRMAEPHGAHRALSDQRNLVLSRRVAACDGSCVLLHHSLCRTPDARLAVRG